MPLQNRVDPFGNLHAMPSRGMFTGNRGVIHDPATKTLVKRRWTTRAWLICSCEFRGRRRDVMGRNGRNGGAGWTELFFLDEVTALAAGHRPCFYCRREKAAEYADCFGKAFGTVRPKVAEIDARLHAERLASGGLLRSADLEALPAGALVADGEQAFALKDASWFQWSWDGYVKSPLRHVLRATLVTPSATVAVLRAGYRPVWHPTA